MILPRGLYISVTFVMISVIISAINVHLQFDWLLAATIFYVETIFGQYLKKRRQNEKYYMSVCQTDN